MSKHIKGKIIRFGQKGFGFILADNGNEYFLHKNDVENGQWLRVDDEISFLPDKNEKGLIAREVQLIRSSSSNAKLEQTNQKPNRKLSKTTELSKTQKYRKRNSDRKTNHCHFGASSYCLRSKKIFSVLMIASIILNIYLLSGYFNH